jgi:hypothetical protein
MTVLSRIFAAGLMVLGLSGCAEQWTWRQKLTVSVATPSGLKVASSVQQGIIEKYGWWQQQWGYGGGTVLKGEAVVVEVGPGKYLFALLKGTPLAWDVFLGRKTPMEVAGHRLESLRGNRELTRDQFPLLVTFGDINDPKSVRLIDPANLAASFGPGYRLDAITMTITDEPVTEGKVEPVLGWLNWPRERFLAAGNGENPVKIYGNGLVTPLDRNDFRNNR